MPLPVRLVRRLRCRPTLILLLVCVATVAGAVLATACTSGPKKGSELQDLSHRETGVSNSPAAQRKSWAGGDPAPAFPAGLTWFNVTKPLQLPDLAGKAVLLDFWTLGCINCQDIIPDLKRLEDEYKDSLVVIGVHSGKYSTEHDDASIKEAIGRYGLRHAVVNDPDFTVWNSYGVNAWPTLVLIDPQGKVVGSHAGEGVYPLFQPIIRALVTEFEGKGLIDRAKAIPVSFESTATSTVLAYPSSVEVDQAKRLLYIADAGHNRILVSDVDGRLVKAIGSGKEGFADGGAQEAQFRGPQGLALSPDGATLYVADTRNHAIRSVDTSSGEVTTIAGTGRQLDQLPREGEPPTKVSLAAPWDVVVVDRTLFITMAGVHQIWAYDLDAKSISVFAGSSREGIQDGARATATLAQPSGIAADSRYLYWVDPESSSVRRLPFASVSQGQVETMVGTGLFDYGDQDGTGTAAKLQHAQGIAIADGKLYVGDTYNHKVRVVDAGSFKVTTLAGSTRGWADGTGPSAKFDEPGGLAVALGFAYVADTNNHLIRKVDVRTGAVSTLTLTNLAAVSSAPAQQAQQAYPAVTVAAGIGSIRLSLKAPSGYHLNSQGPSRLQTRSSNPSVATIGDASLTWATDEASIEIPVPLDLKVGSTTVTLIASVYYCRTGAEALCFIHQAELTVPIVVSAAATDHDAMVQYDLPAG